MDDGPLRIDFRGGRHRLPTLEFERVVGGDLLASLVQDRAVLIGAASDPFSRGIATPLSRDHDLLTELQYRGFVLDTLLRDSSLARSTSISFVLTAFAALLGALLGQTISLRAALFVSAVSGLAYVAAAWLCLGTLAFQLPPLDLLIAQPLACSFVQGARHFDERNELRRAARRTTALVRTLPEVPSRPSETNTPWHHLSQLLKTTAGIERLLILEVSRDGESACEIHSEGCEIDSKRKHDLLKPPYSEVTRTNLAQELDQPIFEAASPRSVQYLLPLSDHGRWLEKSLARRGSSSAA